MEKIENWTLYLNDESEQKYMKDLFVFIKDLFVEIFGEGIMSSERCIVYNDRNESCPMLIINTTPIKIRTCANSLGYWSQYVYQLSHELMHYVIRQVNEDKDSSIKWFEETICEAMSLYILSLASERWQTSKLYEINPKYASNIIYYVEQMYWGVEASKLKACKTLEDLKKIEVECEIKREDREEDRNELFDIFREMTEEIYTIIYYTKYMNKKTLLINFNEWEKDGQVDKRFIRMISKIQPVIQI